MSNTISLLHGTRKDECNVHIGMCLTASENAASMYAGSGDVYEVEIDLDGLMVVNVAGYDRETNTAPGDNAASIKELASLGYDVIIFDDEDENGRQHECYRLVSEKAVSATQVLEIA